MRAARVHEFGGSLRIEELPDPVPGTGEVVVAVEASGLCHTDIHACHGDWPVKPHLPLIPGHEGVGLVAAVGAGVSRVREGDRVAVPWLGWACGACEHCVNGWETLCLSQRNTGYGVDGCYSDRVLASADFVGLVPDGVDPFDAAPLTCAGVTTYKAVKVSAARSSDLVAVVGVGGLGHMALQYAKIAGATVVAVDVHEDKLRLARDLGASYTVNAAEHDPVEEIQRLGGADAAIVLAATPDAARQAFGCLKRGGRLVFVGLPRENDVAIPIFETVLGAITVTGSIVGTRRDLAETFELHASGMTRVIRETRTLDQVNESFEDVLSGRVPARIVFDMAA